MTFFIQAPANSAIVSQALDFASDSTIQPLPVIKMPMIKIPRSAKRNYDDGELACAALMMEKLRRREDTPWLIEDASDSQTIPVDLVVEKLLHFMS